MPNTINAQTAKVQARRGPKNVSELLYRFGQTPEVRELSGETARQLRRITKRIHLRLGRLTITEIERPEIRPMVYDWRDEMANTPAECERTIRTLARCIAWGVDRGLIRENRLEGIRFRWRGTRGRADIVWSPEDILAIRPHLGELRGAFEIAMWTGLRQGDLLQMKRSQLQDGWLCVVPEKTRNTSGISVHLPVDKLPPLRTAIDRLMATPGHERLLGRCWAPRHFRRMFDQAKRAAGLSHFELHWHDLRGTLVTWLLEAGCTQAETASVIGHAPAEGITARYAAQSRIYSAHAYDKLHTYLTEHLNAVYQ